MVLRPVCLGLYGDYDTSLKIILLAEKYFSKTSSSNSSDIFSFYNYHYSLSSYIRCFEFHITHRIKNETTGYDVIGTIMVKAKNLTNTESHYFSMRMIDLFSKLFVRDAFEIYTGEKKSDNF